MNTKQQKSEEVEAIIEKMPSRFGIAITCLVGFLFISLLFFGWIIRYPDIVTGEITISANTSPIKLIAGFSGKIHLLKRSDEPVKEGDYIAVIQNGANYLDVIKLQSLILNWKNGNNLVVSANVVSLPPRLSLGELNDAYYALLNSFSLIENFKADNIYSKQDEIYDELIIQKSMALSTLNNKLKLSKENLKLVDKFVARDSILFSKKVLTESEKDRSQMSQLSARDAVQSIFREIRLNQAEIDDLKNKKLQNIIQKHDKEKQLYIDANTALNKVEDNIKLWESKYAFKAPFNGLVQFLKFWEDYQFIQLSDAAFAVVPEKNAMRGHMVLPANGAGKVRPGQEVIIKLHDYPYTEYGSISGKISTISSTTNSVKTEKGDLETYLLQVDLPNGLKTNYGSTLNFKFDIKGAGEIVTNDRRLIERLFDNLKYSVQK